MSHTQPRHGGKTALIRHIYSTLVDRGEHVLIIDLKEYRGRYDRAIREAYEDQFNGDFHLWLNEPKRTLLIDNLSSSPTQIDLITDSAENFSQVFATLTTDTFYSYFKDDSRFLSFRKFEIEPLTHVKQEELIRKRIGLMEHEAMLDGSIDEFERRVNSVIANGIVPRYPFYVLSILQTFEVFMPKNLGITSYGHCYYVLIVASLIKAGIADKDEEINVCINFAEHLAFRVFERRSNLPAFDRDDFDLFVEEYRSEYIIRDSMLNRLKHPEHGILKIDGTFRVRYMQHYFLGSYLAKPVEGRRKVVDDLIRRNHIEDDHLTLLFVIHHAMDDYAIERIIEKTTQSFPRTPAATLGRGETKRFAEIIAALADQQLSSRSVNEERRREREVRDSDVADDDSSSGSELEEVNDWYRILKNMDVLGHVLRVRYGKMTKDKISEVVETIAEGGLRTVNTILKDDDEIADIARYLKTLCPDADLGQIQKLVRFWSFLWTMVNVERIVDSVRHRAIRSVVAEVIERKHTPAYDIIGYFSLLDSADELTEHIGSRLDLLRKTHDDPFIRDVLSIRTQRYMNTHRSKAVIEQKICSSLRIRYKHRSR